MIILDLTLDLQVPVDELVRASVGGRCHALGEVTQAGD